MSKKIGNANGKSQQHRKNHATHSSNSLSSATALGAQPSILSMGSPFNFKTFRAKPSACSIPNEQSGYITNRIGNKHVSDPDSDSRYWDGDKVHTDINNKGQIQNEDWDDQDMKIFDNNVREASLWGLASSETMWKDYDGLEKCLYDSLGAINICNDSQHDDVLLGNDFRNKESVYSYGTSDILPSPVDKDRKKQLIINSWGEYRKSPLSDMDSPFNSMASLSQFPSNEDASQISMQNFTSELRGLENNSQGIDKIVSYAGKTTEGVVEDLKKRAEKPIGETIVSCRNLSGSSSDLIDNLIEGKTSPITDSSLQSGELNGSLLHPERNRSNLSVQQPPRQNNGPARLINLHLRSCYNCIQIIDKLVVELCSKMASSARPTNATSANPEYTSVQQSRISSGSRHSTTNLDFEAEYRTFMEETERYFDSKVSYSRSPSKIDNLLKKACVLQCEILFITSRLESMKFNNNSHGVIALSGLQRDVIFALNKPITDLQWARNCERIIGASDSCLLDLGYKLSALTSSLERVMAIFLTLKNAASVRM
ncbi:MAG: hypothetical protein MHMPM18_000425 [Marteilia pararefringens]